jgi:hypothetical protein
MESILPVLTLYNISAILLRVFKFLEMIKNKITLNFSIITMIRIFLNITLIELFIFFPILILKQNKKFFYPIATLHTIN